MNSSSKKIVHETCLAISGGGCKAIYGLGIGVKLKEWGIKIKEVSGVSAGAAMALAMVSETEEKSIEYMEELVRRNESNFYASKLLFGERPFPHENIYRRIIKYGLDINKILKTRIKIYILSVKAIPREENKFEDMLKKTRLITETMSAYLADEADREKGIVPDPPRVEGLMKKWNMEEVIFTNKDLIHPEIVEQIVLNSSSIPPVLSFQNSKDEYYLDGGVTNNLLIESFPKDAKKIAIYYEDTTITHKNPDLLKTCFLIKPSRKLPIQTFDYTSPEGVRETFELGKSDAESLKKQILKYTERVKIERKPKSHGNAQRKRK